MRPITSRPIALAALGLSAALAAAGCESGESSDSETPSEGAANLAGSDDADAGGAGTAGSDATIPSVVPEPDAEPDASEGGQEGGDGIPEPEAPQPVGPGAVWEFLAHQVTLLPPDQGFDIDGDGTVDNALSELLSDPQLQESFGGDPNEWLGKEVEDGDLAILLRIEDVHEDVVATADGDAVSMEIYVGGGLNVADQHLVSCDSYDDDGEPASRFDEATLTGTELEAGPGTFRFVMTFAANMPLVFREAHSTATVAAEGASLDDVVIGGLVILTEIHDILDNDPELTESAKFLFKGLFDSIADIDLDSDGEVDGVSAGFGMAAGPTEIDTNSACIP